MPEPLKILFLLEDLCFGGTQRQSLELAARLKRQRFAPQIMTLTGRTDLDDLAKAANIPLVHLGKSRKPGLFFFLRLGRALQSLRPDLLIPCTALPNIWGRIWGRILGLNVIGTVRGGGAPRRQHERLLWRLTEMLVCNSQALIADLCRRGVPEGHLRYIPNGVDMQRFCPGPLPLGQRPERILCVARLAGDKDHFSLLRAFASLSPKRPQASLRLVGDGPLESKLRDFISQELAPEIQHRITIVSGKDDLAGEYAEARIFALSSVREGQPNVILEAMSSGLPVCATSVGGIPGLIHQGENGLLSPAREPLALAQNILELLDNPGLCAKMGANGRKRVAEDFSFKAMVERHEALFAEVWQKTSAQATSREQ